MDANNDSSAIPTEDDPSTNLSREADIARSEAIRSACKNDGMTGCDTGSTDAFEALAIEGMAGCDTGSAKLAIE